MGRAPEPRLALERFVGVHALVRGGRRDTPAFRRELHESLALDRDPRLHRYWRLVTRVTGVITTLGMTHFWLLDALERSLQPEG
jgi:hypothetical protein